MNNHFQLISSRHRKRNLNFYKWTSLFCLFLVLISSSVLIYRQWAIRTKLQELKEQAQRQYLLQEINLVSTNDLVNSPKIHAFFTDLLNTYAEKFAKNKNLNTSLLPLKFAGFYSDPNPGNGYRKMGQCWKEQRIAKISLNRLYLLTKFGHDKYFPSNPEQSGDYTYLEISFDNMLHTCSHELAHYLQLVKYGKSRVKLI